MSAERAELVARLIQRVAVRRTPDADQDRLVRDLRRAWILGDWTAFDRIARELECATRATAN